VKELEEPLLSTSLILPGESDGLSDPYEIRERLEHQLDLVIDAGNIEFAETTVIEFTNKGPEIIRQGIGMAPMLD
jgi:tRNA A37 threonylcarbamoyladenosine synthetase subunit TsaC/SUA5/YrdC